MKKNILIITAILLATSLVSAQSMKEEVDLVQAAFGMEKKAVVAGYVEVSEAQADAFWALYDEYEAKRKTLGQQRVALLEQYAEQYETLTGEQADAWTRKVIQLQSKTDKLISTYYKKVLKVSDGKVATQFYQVENYVLTEIRALILEDVPFVDEY